jgi:hypothetical protein
VTRRGFLLCRSGGAIGEEAGRQRRGAGDEGSGRGERGLRWNPHGRFDVCRRRKRKGHGRLETSRFLCGGNRKRGDPYGVNRLTVTGGAVHLRVHIPLPLFLWIHLPHISLYTNGAGSMNSNRGKHSTDRYHKQYRSRYKQYIPVMNSTCTSMSSARHKKKARVLLVFIYVRRRRKCEGHGRLETSRFLFFSCVAASGEN